MKYTKKMTAHRYIAIETIAGHKDFGEVYFIDKEVVVLKNPMNRTSKGTIIPNLYVLEDIKVFSPLTPEIFQEKISDEVGRIRDIISPTYFNIPKPCYHQNK